MSLQAKLDAHKAGFVAQVPSEALAVMQRAGEELAASGILDRVLKVGEPAPEFALENAAGKQFDLSTLVANGPLVVNFFRGRW